MAMALELSPEKSWMFLQRHQQQLAAMLCWLFVAIFFSVHTIHATPLLLPAAVVAAGSSGSSSSSSSSGSSNSNRS
jgi:hypothetical protein